MRQISSLMQLIFILVWRARWLLLSQATDALSMYIRAKGKVFSFWVSTTGIEAAQSMLASIARMFLVA